LERAICEKADVARGIAIREFERAPKSKEHIAAIAANIDREEFQRYSVFYRSLNIQIEYYVIPLLKTVIQIETDIRIKNRLPFAETRIAHLREELRTMALDMRRDLAWNAYRDSTEHVKKHSYPFKYIEEELEQARTKLERTTPEGIFSQIDEILKIASADVKLGMSSE
jgi:hypothetical protein